MKKLSIPLAAIALATLIGLFAVIGVVKANPLAFNRFQTASATSTLAYLMPGAATTTLTLDAQNGNNFAANSAELLIQLKASSTLTTLKWRYEYSQDAACQSAPATVNWYAESINLAAATASSTVEVRDFKEYSWNYASTSIQGTQTVATPFALKAFSVATPTKCVRVIFYLPIGSANAGIWAEFVNVKEISAI